MKTVAFVSNSLVGAGAERIVARLLSNPTPFDHQISRHLILLDDDEIAYPIPSSVPVHCLDTKGSLLRGAVKLKAKLAEVQPDICVSFGTRSNLLTVSVAKLAGTRVVISERVNSSRHHAGNLSGSLAKHLTRIVYRHADSIIAVSQGVAQDLRENFGVPAEIISVVANPVDKDHVTAQAAEQSGIEGFTRPVVVAMGRLVPNKNFSLLIEAFRRWGRGGTLIILGKGPLREQLRDEIVAAGLGGRVFLAGFKENPFAIMGKADCFVLPSNSEGFPNGLVEAMILGVPVIATNCPSGPAEILDDRADLEVSDVYEGKYGLLVPMEAPDALSRALNLALAPGQRELRSRSARLGAVRYDLTNTLATYWRIILGQT